MTDDPEPREPVPDPAVTPTGSPDPEGALGKLDARQKPALFDALDRFYGAAPTRCQFLAVDESVSRCWVLCACVHTS